MMKQKLMTTVVGLCLGLSAVSAGATGWPVYDVMRTAKFGGQGVQRLLGLISEYQKTSADSAELEVLESKREIKKLPGKQENNAQAAGEAGAAENKQVFIEYWTGAKPSEMESNTLMPGKSDVEAAKEWLRTNYYLPIDTVEEQEVLKEVAEPNGAGSIEKKKKNVKQLVCVSTIDETQRHEMKQKRQKYVEALSKETLSLADGARKSIANELTTLKEAETTGAAQVQQIDLMVQTKKAMIEQKIADLYLQTRLMETEAMGMMMGQSMQLLAEPKDGESLCINNQVWTMGGEKK